MMRPQRHPFALILGALWKVWTGLRSFWELGGFCSPGQPACPQQRGRASELAGEEHGSTGCCNAPSVHSTPQGGKTTCSYFSC